MGTPRPSSVIIRTRPDVAFNRWFTLNYTIYYFENGARGRSLILGQDGGAAGDPDRTQLAQGDIHAFFSYGAYKKHIGEPFETGQWVIAICNGKAWGFPLCGYYAMKDIIKNT